MLKRRRWTVGLAVSGAIVVACAAVWAAVGLPALCPGSNVVPGWQVLDADKLASNPDELWKIYNGGDAEWKTAGVTSAFARHYQNQQTKKVLTLTINKTGTDWTKAKKLYRAKNDSGEGKLSGLPGYQTVQLKQEGSLATPAYGGVYAHFWAKYYYCTVESGDASAASVSAAKQFMQKVSANITKNG